MVNDTVSFHKASLGVSTFSLQPPGGTIHRVLLSEGFDHQILDGHWCSTCREEVAVKRPTEISSIEI